jgi:hypothetical protein
MGFVVEEVALGQASSEYFGLAGCRDSSVGIATDNVLDGRVSISGRGKIFLFRTTSIPALGPT